MTSQATGSAPTDGPAAAWSGDEVTLRAGADGSTARVSRGVLATFSRIFKDVLSSCKTVDELPLPGKTKAQLDLLVAWLRREEEFTAVG